MLTMARRGLRQRWFAALGSIIAVMLGSALASAAMILDESATTATPGDGTTPWALRGADLVVRMPDQTTDERGRTALLTERRRLTEEQLAAIRATPGVASLTIETPSPAYLVSGGRKIGNATRRSWSHPWSTAAVEPFVLSRGEAPTGADDVVLDSDTASAAGVDVGDQVTVMTTKGTSQYRVTGVGRWPGAQFEHAIFVTDPRAAQLGGSPLLALVRVSGDRASVAEALRRALPGAEVTTDRAHMLQLDRSQAELSGGSSQFMTLMAMSALGVAALVIASTLSVSVRARRRELALLRTVGATPGRIRRLILGEAAFMGLIAGVLGGLLGIGLGAGAIRFFAARGMVSRSVDLELGVMPFGVGVGVAVVTAILAGSLPAWHASRVSPADAMLAVDVQPERSSRARVIWGLLMLAIAVGGVAGGAVVAAFGDFTAMAVAGVLFMMSAPFLILAAILLGRALLSAALTGVSAVVGPLSRRSFGMFMATRQIRGDLSRAVGVTTPVLLMVSFACLMIFQERATFEGRSRGYEQQLRIDLAVRGTEQLGLPPGWPSGSRTSPGYKRPPV